jgi:hypothetical protein
VKPAVDEELVALLDQRVSEMKTSNMEAALPRPEATGRADAAKPQPAAEAASVPAPGGTNLTKVAWAAAMLGALAVLVIFWWVMMRQARRAT